MGKLKSFYVELENPNGVYYAGQIMNGRLVVELIEEMHMKEIRLIFKGGAEVYWTETYTSATEGGDTRDNTETFAASETYFNQSVPVYGRGLGMGDKCRLPPGQHFYPFSFQLPSRLPSSFEGGDGYVRYTIRGVIDRSSWIKKDKDTKKPFTVIALLDLNTYPNSACATQNQKSKNVCCLCCKSGPVTGKIRVDRIGHVPGDTVRFQSEIQNLTNRVCKSYVKFYMSITFRTPKKCKAMAREITRVNHQDVPPGDSEAWAGETFSIPSVPPSDLIGCRIIDVDYFIELVAMKLHIPAKIIIGTIPLQVVTQQYQTHPGVSAPQLSAQASSYLPTSIPTPSAPPMADTLPKSNTPLPSYSESVFGRTSIKESSDSEKTRGDMNFAPSYAYYDWSRH
eukprot:XP_011450385.1 PREDICTED: arrestin domain-containing protein 17 [Crassostrea gigas]